MARRKRVANRAAPAAAGDEPPIDVAVIGQGVSTFETNNGLAHGIIGTAVVVLAVLIVRPVARALRAFLRR